MDPLCTPRLVRPSGPRLPRRFAACLACLVAVALLAGACDVASSNAPSASATVDQLLSTLASGSTGDRVAAAEALGQSGDPRAVGPLSAALDDSSTDVRVAAAVALGRIGDAGAAGRLAALLAGGSTDERAAAASALSSIGDAAIPALVGQLAADDASDHAISAALASFGASAVGPLKAALTGDVAAARTGAAAALGKMGSTGIPALSAALHDSTMAVRLAAIDGLYAAGAGAVPNLVTALKDKEAKVRSAAANRLGRLGDRQAEKSLVVLLKDSAVWKTASIGLARLYKGDATSILHYLDAKATIRVYYGLIRLGEAGTDQRLASALIKLGDLEMAEEYLNCGNSRLEDAAHTWADQHGYDVVTRPGVAGGTWGSGLSD